tara:strand:+ start:1943 stop:3400 length:1458 start_codon:yes stop_codon:yes gene_type:complete
MFKRWCKEQKFNNATNLSHVLMDGGVLSVPFDKLNIFYEKYIKAIESGEKLFIVEQKSDVYNFFVDIDYKDDQPMTMSEIRDVCKIICDKVKRHGGRDCLISVAPPKMIGDLVKTGIHMNWYGYVVDQSSALALRDHILIALSTVKSSMDWNEIIDVSVYGSFDRKTKGSGLRMPWSHKMAKHIPCGGQGCELCDKGKIVQAAYLPVFMYTPEPLSTLMRIDQTPSIKILSLSAVRTNEVQHVNIEPPSIVIKEGTFTEAQTKDEVHNNQLKEMIEEFIQENLEGQKAYIVTKIFKHKDTYLVSTNSKYCENLKRAHSSNHVWFHISGKIIAQKCFCRCETIRGRRDGFCKDFYGRKYELPDKIIQRLYPVKNDINKCPEIKKFEEKPQIKQSDVKPGVESFIQRFIIGQKDTKVVSISQQKNNFMVLTTSSYCEQIQSNHENHSMSYIIEKNKIKQKCPICKKCPRVRTYILSSSVVNELSCSR